MSSAPANPDGLTFVLPIRNPGAILEPALNAWGGELKKLRRPVQVIIIDEGSDDFPAVESTVQKVIAKHGLNHQLIRSSSPPGFGASLRQALAVATEPLLFYTSLEYPYIPAEIHDFVKRIEEKDAETGLSLHFVNGYRSLTPLPAGRAFLGKLWRAFLKLTVNVPSDPLPGWLGKSSHRFRFWMRTLFGLRIQDVNSHFKIFRREIFQRIPLQSNGEFVHGEILAKANFLGCYMDEVSVAKQQGPIKVPSEIPPVSKDVYREMRIVLKRPDFGPWPLETAPASEIPVGQASSLPG